METLVDAVVVSIESEVRAKASLEQLQPVIFLENLDLTLTVFQPLGENQRDGMIEGDRHRVVFLGQ